MKFHNNLITRVLLARGLPRFQFHLAFRDLFP